MKPIWARGKSSSYRSKQPVQNVNPASTTPARSSHDNEEVVVAQGTPSPDKRHRVIPREKSSYNENAYRLCYLTQQHILDWLWTQE